MVISLGRRRSFRDGEKLTGLEAYASRDRCLGCNERSEARRGEIERGRARGGEVRAGRDTARRGGKRRGGTRRGEARRPEAGARSRSRIGENANGLR